MQKAKGQGLKTLHYLITKVILKYFHVIVFLFIYTFRRLNRSGLKSHDIFSIFTKENGNIQGVPRNMTAERSLEYRL